MEKKNLKMKDILLTLLYLPGVTNKKNEPIIGRTRIIKMMYIFKKEILSKFNNIDLKSAPEFFPFLYGPFSKDLLDDIRFFCTIEFIKEETTGEQMSNPEIIEYGYDVSDDIGYGEELDIFDDAFTQTRYYLIEKGIVYVENKILNKFTLEQKDLLTKFKQKINTLSLDAILNYVYNKYPESAKNSKIKERYLKV